MLLILIFSTNQGWWKPSDHSNLAHTEKFAVYGQRLIFQNLVGEIIEHLRFLSNRRTNLTLAPAIKTFKGSQHQGILASVRCNNLVTTLMLDITGGWDCFWCMDAYVWVGGGVLCPFVFPVLLVRKLPVQLFSSPRKPLGKFRDGSQGAVREGGSFVVFVGVGVQFCPSGAVVCASSTVLGLN